MYMQEPSTILHALDSSLIPVPIHSPLPSTTHNMSFIIFDISASSSLLGSFSYSFHLTGVTFLLPPLLP